MTENERLYALEGDIETFQEQKFKAATALWKIRKDDLYRIRDYDTVVEYARQRYGIRSTRVTQLISYARVVDILEGKDEGVPHCEAHARPLGRLLDGEDEDAILPIWQKVTERHGLQGVTMTKVREAKFDYLHSADGDGDDDDGDEDEEPDPPDLSLNLPSTTADVLGLSGDLRRGRRVVPFDGIDRTVLQEIIEQTEPKTAAPPNTDEDPVLGSKSWAPVREALEFRPDDVQRLQHASLPPSNQGRQMEDTRTLTCPNVDLLSDDVPAVFTEEVLSRAGGTDWEPVFLSSHAGRWTDYSLPSEAWVGATADRSTIEETAEVFDEADNSEVKWTLYDISGEDRREGLPDVDLSVLDWLVIDELTHTDLPISQLDRIQETAADHDITVAVRSPFTTKLDATP